MDSESSIVTLSCFLLILVHLFILFILPLSELSEIRTVTSPMHLFFIRYRLKALVTWIGRFSVFGCLLLTTLELELAFHSNYSA